MFQYADKKKSTYAMLNVVSIKEISSIEMEHHINDLSKNILLVRNLIAPVLNIIFEEQNIRGGINLCKVSASNTGLW